MSRRLAALALVAVLAHAACAGIRQEELPPEPLAFIYRTAEEAKERAELLDPEARPRATPGRSVVRMQQVERTLRHIAGDDEQSRLIDTIGRLSLFYPATGEVKPLGVAQRGSRPIDWSPDRTRLYFSALRGGRPQVFAYDLETMAVSRVVSGADAHPEASVGPDGQIAFARVVGTAKDPRSRIWILDAEGRRRPLTEGPDDFRPRFSPRGDVILYSSFLPSGDPAIFRVVPDGSEPPRLVARGIDPDFAPDGTWVVFSQWIKGQWQIWRMKPDGTGKYAIGGATTAVAKLDATHPTVSPDGRFIAYVLEELGRQELRLRRADGSGDRPLVEGADGGNPVW